LNQIKSAERPAPEELLVEIADYVSHATIDSREAYETARYCLLDSLGCALLALKYPACTKILGPVVAEAEMRGGARVPGTQYELDPVQAAFNIGTMIRWLDFNDTWLASEWGHPSDNFGGILAIADYPCRQKMKEGKEPLLMHEVLTAAIKAYEIQGVLALDNAFNRVGLDHVLLVRVATTAVVTHLLGGSKEDVINAVSNAWMDGGALRSYRHAPNTGSRKSWAAGDATSRGVRLALLTLKGEMGYPTVLSAPVWGFYDVLFKGKPFKLQKSFGSYVIENILFKISYPAEFHAQTAVEVAIQLHPQIIKRLAQIDRISIETQEAAVRIIDKTGPLNNPADRDHCLQYMVAIGLIYGGLTADHYEDKTALNPQIDTLRNKMVVKKNSGYSHEYLDPEKRSIANGLQIFFKDGSKTEKVEIEYPIGHRKRRKEALPLLLKKFETNITTRLSKPQCQSVMELCQDQKRLEKTPVREFIDLFAV